jgi:enoyl-CoA hydratase/carnithine racemase
VVLHGSGPSFCSGLDVAGVMASQHESGDLMAPLREAVPNWFQRTVYRWLEVPAPVIVAIHGHCLGGGLQIALGGDVRFARPDSKLSVLEVKWGLIPDMAITRTLPRLVGIDVAKELAFTGRIISGSEASELGLVTHLADDPLAAAQALAAEIAERSPDAVRAMKRLFNESWTGGVEETLRLEADLQLGLLGTPNQLEAVRAGMLKEPAQFTDPS